MAPLQAFPAARDVPPPEAPAGLAVAEPEEEILDDDETSWRQISLLRSRPSRARSIPGIRAAIQAEAEAEARAEAQAEVRAMAQAEAEIPGRSILSPRESNTSSLSALVTSATAAGHVNSGTTEKKKAHKGWSSWLGISPNKKKKKAPSASNEKSMEGSDGMQVKGNQAETASMEAKAAEAAENAAAAATREREESHRLETNALALASLSGVHGSVAGEQLAFTLALVHERRASIEELMVQAERFRSTIVSWLTT